MTASGRPPLILRPPAEVWLDSSHPASEHLAHDLGRFADLIKTPNPFSVYRITRYSMWNALAAGLTAVEILDTLTRASGSDVPPDLASGIRRLAERYGCLRIVRHGDDLLLEADTSERLRRLTRGRTIRGLCGAPAGDRAVRVDPAQRGALKLALCRAGYPVEDRAGFAPAEALDVMAAAAGGLPLRPYQRAALDAYLASETGGSGVVVLPCGAGKTMVGIAALVALRAATLIVVPGTAVARQWISALRDLTTLPPDAIGEYSGEKKEIRPVTVATYATLARQVAADGGVVVARAWGLIVYDEVHALPAPVFRTTAAVQARRRLGLTATLVREDGREADVFSLIGPKRYDAAWPDLTAGGWIAPVECVEVRVALPPDLATRYAAATRRGQARLAATNPQKAAAVRRLLAGHVESTALIIGHYLDQLRDLAAMLEAPLVTGAVDSAARERVYAGLRDGSLRRAVLSRVANQAIDIPAADLAIEVSGAFGSRQEEAQRLGRVLRPKAGRTARFYTVVTAGTVEEEYAARRQRFLLERGYRFRIVDWRKEGDA